MVMSVLDKPKQTAGQILAASVGMLPATTVLKVRYTFVNEAARAEFIDSVYATNADVRAEGAQHLGKGEGVWFTNAPEGMLDITATVTAHLQAARFSMVQTAVSQVLTNEQKQDIRAKMTLAHEAFAIGSN